MKTDVKIYKLSFLIEICFDLLAYATSSTLGGNIRMQVFKTRKISKDFVRLQVEVYAISTSALSKTLYYGIITILHNGALIASS